MRPRIYSPTVGGGGKEGEQSQEGRSIPEVWLGQPVWLAFVSASSTEYTGGVHEDVNDKDIVVSTERHVGHPAQPLF